MGYGKEKRPAYQTQGQLSNLEGKKKNLKCFHCKKMDHIKLKCKKIKVDLVANSNSNHKKGPES